MKEKSNPTKKPTAKPAVKSSRKKQSKPNLFEIKAQSNIREQPNPEYMSYAHCEPIPTVQSVALVAASLFEKKATTTHEAVCLAIDLMENAAWILNGIKHDNQIERLSIDPEEEERRLEKMHYNFLEGAKEITGQKRSDRARKYLIEFWKSIEKNITELNKKIREYEDKGFNGIQLRIESMAYHRRGKNVGPKKFRPRKMI